MGRPSLAWRRPSYTADVSVVIVSYNTRDVLESNLRALIASKQRSSLEVIVVDNVSRDGSAEMVRQRFPQVRCVSSERNLGHSGGTNLGMAMANGRYLLILNPDTHVPSGAIDQLVEYLDANARVGAAAPKVLNVDGSVQGSIKNFPTPLAALFGRYSLLTRLFPNNRFSHRYLVYLDQDFSRPFAVDSASCCALMVRREAIDCAGPLDEGYFLHWNDVDWCRAMWAAGYEVHCVPSAEIVHDEHKGGTQASRAQRLRSIVIFHQGAYRYYRKWHVPHAWHPAHLLALLGLSARALIVVATEQVRYGGAR